MRNLVAVLEFLVANGFTQIGITTPGVGGPEDWNTNPSGTSISSSYWDDDVYLFEYTAGVTNENISMTIDSRNSWFGIGIFDNCTGTTFDTELDANGSTTSGVLTVSAAIAPGNTVYIAVGQWGTPNDLDFDVTDFTVNQVSCPDPSLLTATNISGSSADLAWTENGTATVWDIEYGVAPYTPTGIPTASGVANPYNYSGLTPNTTYEFYVRADCGGTSGTSAWAGPYSFFTGYCTPNPSSVDNDGITNVTIGTINNTTTTELGNYGDYTALVTDVQQSISVDLSVTVTYNNYNVFAWIDWNNDLDFDDAGETYYVGEFATTGVVSIPVPAAASLGNHRLRIGGADSGLGSTIPSDPCYTGSWGAFEDYTLNVIPAPACVPPSLLTASNITATSADLAWTENGTATVWDIEYGVAPYTPTGTPTASGVTNPYNYSGLTANTTYEFYVRADCGGTNGVSAWVGPYSFTTPCNTAAITYTQDFTTWPMNCWDLTGGAQSWGDNGSGIALANFWSWPNPTDAIMSTEPIDISVDARVRFDWSHLYSATYPLDSLSVDVKVLPGGTWTSIWGKGGSDLESNDGAGNTTPGSMITETILLDPATYTGQDVQVRFVATSGYGPDLFVDNLIIEPVPACIDPSGLTASNITTTSADLSWTENGTATSWEVEYDSTGFVQGTGNTAVTGTNPHALTGLTANYSYDFYVRAICGVGDTSAWDGPYSFVTPCNTAAITYTQDFTTWPLNCWDLTGGSQSWSDNGSGIALANFWSWQNPTDAIMSTEPIDISVDARVRFDWSHLYSATYPLDSLSVDVKVLPGGTWTSIWGKGGSDLESNDGAGNQTPGSMVTETILLDPTTYTGQDVQVRFVATSGWGPDLFVDNLIIEPVPACVDPSGLTASNITTTSADLAWTENGTATSWEVEYDSTGFVQGTGNSVVTGTNPHALTGLSANYSYDFYVRAICGVGDSSAWAGPYSFTTPCNTAAITYTQDFTTWPMNCWDLTGGAQSWGDNGSGIALANFWSWPNPTDAIMSTEPIDISVDARVRFDWSHLYSATYPLDSLSVDVKVLPGGTWTSIWGKGGSDLESNDGAGNTTPGSMITETILLDPATYTGQDVQVRFVATSGYGPDLFVDNLIIEPVPACIDPSGLTASNITTTSADLAWTENGTATSWEVEYDSTGFVQGTGNSVVTGTNPHALTGLSANYSYDFYVRAICGVGDSSAWAGPYSFATYGDCSSSGVYDYGNNEDSTNAIGFVANTPGDYITLTFTGGITEAGYDYWFINDAADGSGTTIATGDGPITGAYESTTGEISFFVNSDGSWSPVGGGGTPGTTWDTFVYDLSCAPPCAGLTVDLGADITLCAEQDSVILDAGAGPYAYEWSTQETSQTIVVSDSAVGTVEYSVLVTDTISMCQVIDTVNVTFDDCSNISELTGSNVSIYPNPSNGNFIISLSNISEQVSVQVNDMQGRLIYSQMEGLKIGKENVISLDNVERGVYLISVSSDKGRYTQSIVIE